MSHSFTRQSVCMCMMSLHLMTFYLDGIMSIYMQCSLYLEYPPSPHLYQLHLVKHQHTFRSQGNVPSLEMTSLTPQANCPSYSYCLCQSLSSMTLAVACNYAFIWVIFFYLCLPLPWSHAPCGKHRVQLIPLCNPSSYLVQVQPLSQEDPLEKEMPLQYSCLENPMDRGAWWATVHGVAKSRTQLSDWACMHNPSSTSVHIMHSANSPWLFPEFRVMRFSPRTCFSCSATPLLGLDFCLVWGFVLWIKGIIGKVLPPPNISCAS